MISPFSLQEAQLDDSTEKILLPPTDPNAEVQEIPGYKLVYADGACPRNYRVYKGDSMIGVIFQYITHWSNGVDSLRYAESVDAAVGLDNFIKGARVSKAAMEQLAREEELLNKEFDVPSEDWLQRKETGGQDRPTCVARSKLKSYPNRTPQFIEYSNDTHRNPTRVQLVLSQDSSDRSR
ncbi:hypothetical protein [Nostoc sp. LEGE 12447]|uniref:hypothetical protein n=1 Tax=Nostoc sp. LEGE 12447 TaxID=1828640 RepID=UPI001D134B88|nr:hypothetical protein [Nostoc sp. LEGE 12447]